MTLSDILPKLHYPTRLEKLVDGWVHGVALAVFTFAVGVGLGLAIIYGVLQRHHGNIRIKSELNHGTSITVDLPQATEAVFEVPETPAVAGPQGSSPRVSRAASQRASWDLPSPGWPANSVAAPSGTRSGQSHSTRSSGMFA